MILRLTQLRLWLCLGRQGRPPSCCRIRNIVDTFKELCAAVSSQQLLVLLVQRSVDWKVTRVVLLRVLPAYLLMQRWLLAHLHDALGTWMYSSICETHLRQLLLQLLLVHLVLGTRVVFVVLYVLDVLDVCVQIVDLYFEINVD